MIYLKYIVVLLPIMAIIDALWIGGVMKGFYKNNLGYIMAESFNFYAALVFYVLYIAGLVYFVVMPGVASGDLLHTSLKAAAFGLIAYGTYDLTNHATLAGWPWIVTVVDMAWGAVITGIVGTVGFFLGGFIS